ncbi:MAG: glutamine--tRNA ligase/YqeY domain fusion protein [Parabacteroides sp.]|uniref:Glutamine--tRNA ligase n=1 Tax=Parabacteroides faecalis TaxID=2924040 RepID=A0ABT0C2N5_9BACT|nr:glutamine--tRNA ligase/YqeY domain fusion protein [Parabacteroides faecalis]MBS7342447.1 glutamine--tRNA ligase/YqeY domain fusion protein [Parabacteroides sp.]MDY6255394.1 glutamine--tRNA ligase/YqeY domain fusion protein [Bacteroidales bacterium]MCI7286298.1 glutamine--tRNA ligase/YqeY domain fusion protein [Parabacteroides sp.]MCI7358056.1 glutamine--tRNA ligase/YqeY domain fusion protein [Parabacteroides sp.]MCJ2381257.1 glutamine--tRNA ligase/YqeY domain fusion protein [Parabacteroides
MSEINMNEVESKKNLNFIEAIVEKDLAEGKNGGRVQTRFPPEPNGYLHIGHAKAICLDFGIAERHNGVCNLRFDDTNPVKEDVEYIDSIKEDIEWLGFHWNNIYYASDYFQQLYDFAIELIKEGKAYVDEQSSELIAQQKGTPTQPGVESPYRNRPIEESLDLFQRMNAGEFEEGSMTLRAKIDMANSNMHFRDPIIYRILKTPHHRTGTHWKVYPMYDFAHGQSDFFEGVTHSLCTLEFVPHRPLYDLFIDWLKKGEDLDDNRPRQTEFNKLNLNYTLMSKRNLLTLVKEGLVNGWDDPRMPTLCGFRRRGYSPESIRKFIDKIGYTTYDALNEFSLLESAVREDLNIRATRVSAVLDPVKLIITNYPEGQVEEMEAINNPEDETAGSHIIEFSRELWMEREDFMEDAPKKFFRMTPGQEVRLKNAYIVKCTGCKKDEAGNVVEVYCEYDPNTRSGMPDSNRKVKGTLHWVSCAHCLPAEVRLYDRLWQVENPRDELARLKDEGLSALDAMKQMINPDSLTVKTNCYVEKFLAEQKPLSYFQFQRIGYFNLDPDSKDGKLVFNRTVSLKDTWSKIKNK